jgi:hypothetical protein
MKITLNIGVLTTFFNIYNIYNVLNFQTLSKV